MSSVTDILLPVFNGYAVTEACLRSLRRNTPEAAYRLIFINDCSTDFRMTDLAKSFLRPQDIYLENKTNRGFVQSINLGLGQSEEHDAVLLNSDTRPAPGWLEGLRRAAYRDEKVAGVNPVTNYATIYSLQELTPLSSEKDLELIAHALEKFSGEEPHVIPTAVGFCFFMKRTVLNHIGKLDEVYGKGYGEENDWCMRARRYGYRIVLEPSSYVFHEGHVSMRAAGVLPPNQSGLLAHEAILHQRYPEYPSLIRDYLQAGDWDHLKARMLEAVMEEKKKGRRRILYSLHRPIDGTSIGGTEHHVRDLVETFSADHVCYVTYVSDAHVHWEEYAAGLKLVRFYPLPASRKFLQLREPGLKALYQKLLTEFEIETVHIHFTMCSVDLLEASSQLELPVTVSLHDYFAISPDYVLSYKYARQTWNWNRAPSSWHFYLLYGFNRFKPEAWRLETANALKQAGKILFPSWSAYDVFSQYFERKKDFEIIEHSPGIYGDSQAKPAAETRKPFTIAFLGGVHDAHKGGGLLRKLIPRLLHHGYRIHVLGSTKSRWQFVRHREFHVHGHYERKKITNLLKNLDPDVVLQLSVFPETYSFTLSEAWLAGLPVIGAPLGAVAERIHRHGGGLVVQNLSVQSVLDALERIRDRGEHYQELLRDVRNIRMKSVEEMKQDYERVYCFKAPVKKTAERSGGLSREGLINVFHLQRMPPPVWQVKAAVFYRRVWALAGRMWGRFLRVTVTPFFPAGREKIERLNVERTQKSGLQPAESEKQAGAV